VPHLLPPDVEPAALVLAVLDELDEHAEADREGQRGQAGGV
jgi:hypothetical protein